ncbi:MAG: acetyl-CoA C-acetyltransferase [Erysipelothrix sp.]|nr:acetyl-CoA C-acetyltransferase [Erysipelothrix sp.]
MNKVYITAARRTAVGSFLGTLKDVPASVLATAVIEAVIKDSKIEPTKIDEVVFGNVLSAGTKQGMTRQAAVNAGIPQTIPAYGVDMLCGSGMKSVINSYLHIKSGLHHAIIAGGAESMSRAPYLVDAKIRSGNKMGNMEMVDHMMVDGLTDAFEGYHMGITAENIAEKYGITREQQDAFAIKSQEKAIAADDRGDFEDEIVGIDVKVRRDIIHFNKDEYINRKTSLEKLSTLRPAFKKDGSVTAGSSSGINDAASATVVVSDTFVKDNNLEPLVEIIGVGQAGVDPAIMGLGPTPAIKNALNQAGLTLQDMDVVELNEAFAAQSLGVIHELVEAYSIDKDALMAKTNINGGAIAIGHPIGASGNRIIVTLIHIMKKQNLKYGLASLCIGGGMGTAIVLKNTDFE